MWFCSKKKWPTSGVLKWFVFPQRVSVRPGNCSLHTDYVFFFFFHFLFCFDSLFLLSFFCVFRLWSICPVFWDVWRISQTKMPPLIVYFTWFTPGKSTRCQHHSSACEGEQTRTPIWRFTTQSSRLLCIPQIHAFNHRAYVQMKHRGFDPLSGGSGMFYLASTEIWPSTESHVVCCQWKSKGHYDLPFWSNNRERGIINTKSFYCCKWLPCQHSDPRCWG